MITEAFKRHLRKNNYYRTRERVFLFETLSTQQNPCSIQELVRLTQEVLDEATVYRNLEIFEEIDVTHRVYTGWRYKVELSDMFREHHHHMTCTRCGNIISIVEPRTFAKEIHKLEALHEFRVLSHSFELRGLCKNCC